MGNQTTKSKRLNMECLLEASAVLNEAMPLLKCEEKNAIPIAAITEIKKLYANLEVLSNIWGFTSGSIVKSLEQTRGACDIWNASTHILKCDLCSCNFQGWEDLMKHIEDKSHIKARKSIRCFISNEGELLEGKLFCTLCKNSFTLGNLNSHMKETNHKTKVKQEDFDSTVITLNGTDIEFDDFINAVQLTHIKDEVDSDIMHYCGNCKFSTQFRDVWERHVSHYHNEERNYVQTFCNSCKLLLGGEKEFTNVHFLSDIHKMVGTLYNTNLRDLDNAGVAESHFSQNRKKQISSQPLFESILTVSGLKPDIHYSRIKNTLTSLGSVKHVEILEPGRAKIFFRNMINTEELNKLPLPEDVYGPFPTFTLERKGKETDQRDANSRSFMQLKENVHILLEEMALEKKKNAWTIIGKDLIQTLGSDYEIHLYGSRITELATETSDYNIMIETSQKADCEQELKTLITNSPKFKVVEYDTQYRTCLLKFYHVGCDAKCVVFVNNMCGIKATNVIRTVMQFDWKVKWMLVAVKCWFKFNKLTGKGGVDRYSITWLVLFYLMHTCPEPLLPPINDLISSDGKCVYTPKTFGEDKLQNKNEILQHLLIGFFSFYKKLDFKQIILCPDVGKFIPSQNNKKFNSRMNIQDPITKSFNTTRKVKEKCVLSFQKFCEEYETLYRL